MNDKQENILKELEIVERDFIDELYSISKMIRKIRFESKHENVTDEYLKNLIESELEIRYSSMNDHYNLHGRELYLWFQLLDTYKGP